MIERPLVRCCRADSCKFQCNQHFAPHNRESINGRGHRILCTCWGWCEMRNRQVRCVRVKEP